MNRQLYILTIFFFLAIDSVFGQTDSIEIIKTNSILINNTVPFITTTKKLKESFGLPDSIIQKTFECNGYFNAEKVNVYYYGQTIFETNGDTVVIRGINFNDGKFQLKTKHLTLDKNTNIKDLKKYYPNSIDKSYDWINTKDNKTYRLVIIKPTIIDDDDWVLIFYNDKLIQIEYWIHC